MLSLSARPAFFVAGEASALLNYEKRNFSRQKRTCGANRRGFDEDVRSTGAFNVIGNRVARVMHLIYNFVDVESVPRYGGVFCNWIKARKNSSPLYSDRVVMTMKSSAWLGSYGKLRVYRSILYGSEFAERISDGSLFDGTSTEYHESSDVIFATFEFKISSVRRTKPR